MSDIHTINPCYKVQRTCTACDGEGSVFLTACSECGEPVSADVNWWQEDKLACEHDVTAVQSNCEVCGGHGSVTHILTEEEYQVLRRKKIIRGIFLLLLGLLPFILLLIAIIARDPDLIFGAPWY